MINQVKQKIGSPKYKDVVEHADALNRDIIATIHKNVPEAIKQAQVTAPLFKGDTKTDTALNIWNFLKQKINYKKDSNFDQYVRLPSRFVNDAQGDCKSYALFTYAILKALGDKDARIRYASYSSIPIPTHVYCVTRDENGKEVIIDGVWKEFDSEKKYKFKKDYNMRVHTLSGVDEETIGKFGDGLKNLGKKIVTAEKKVAKSVKKVATNVKGAIKDVAKAVKTGGVKGIALAPLRGAFLALVALNFRNFAKRLQLAIDRNPNEVKAFWSKWGGDFDQLKFTVKENSKKPAVFGSPKISGIGEPVSATTAIVAAAPIVVAVVELFKKLKLSENTDAQTASEADAGFKTETGSSASSVASSIDKNPAQVTSSFGISTPVLLGGAAIALFLISKNR